MYRYEPSTFGSRFKKEMGDWGFIWRVIVMWGFFQLWGLWLKPDDFWSFVLVAIVTMASYVWVFSLFFAIRLILKKERDVDA